MDLFIGTHYEIGLQIGQKFGPIIRQFLSHEYSNGRLIRPQNAKKYYHITLQYYPNYLEEIRGISHGARIKFSYLFVFMCYELWISRHENCTDMIVKNSATKNGHTIIVHTNDEDSYQKDFVVIYRIKSPDEPELLLITTAGLIINSAVNASGLCFTGNYLCSIDQSMCGVPRSFIYRALIGSKNIHQAVTICTTIPRASAENYVISTSDTQLDIECSAKNHAIDEISDMYVHTNHFIIPKMVKYENYVHTHSSKKRLNRAQSLLKKYYGQLDINLIKSIIADHGDKDPETAICRHTKQVATIFSIIVELETKQIICGLGYPCQKQYIDLPFPEMI